MFEVYRPRRSGRLPARDRPMVIHLTTVDMSLALLLLPQLVGIREAGYEVVGVSAPGAFVRTIEAAGIRHTPLRASTRAVDVRSDLAAAREFLRLCRGLRPDIVHTHNPKPGVYGRIAARCAGVPVVVNTVHGLYAQPQDRRLRRTVVYGLERLAATCSDMELVQSIEDLPTLRRLGIPERRLRLLGNGVDLARFDPARHAAARRRVRDGLGLQETDVLVGLVGRLVREKGYLEVFEAAGALRRTYPQTRFIVVGAEEPEKAGSLTPEELHDAGANGDIQFLGLRDDVERLYPAMYLYVLASHREGFPRSAMEAAAMGLPIVATDIRGCRQVVDHGTTGLLVPARAPRALASAIGGLVSDPQRRRAMGRAARRKALAEFDDRQQVRITLEVYEQLLRRS
jgi:glycosyltransferase involved in cell wall biosynthesis